MTGQLSYTKAECSPPLIEETIGDFFDQIVTRFPEHEALVVRHQLVDGQPLRLTYSQLQQKINVIAKALLALGIQPGDRVGVWSPNCEPWCLIQLATAKIGAILVSLNPSCRHHELRFMLHQSRCNWLVAADNFMTMNYSAELYQLVPELAQSHDARRIHSEDLPELRGIITLSRDIQQGMINWHELAELAKTVADDVLVIRQQQLSHHEPINIQYTSGTTGRPKGATLSHYNILNNAFFIARNMRFSEQDRLVVPVSMYHCFGMVLGTLACISHGATIIYSGGFFTPQSVLQTVHEERATALHGVPSMFIAALNHPHFERYDLTSLRTGVMAGAPCPVELMHDVMQKMHMDEIQIACGMTETSPISLQTHADDPVEKRVNTVGRTQPHQETKIAASDGQPVVRGDVGELCTRGYSLMLGYWDDPEATAAIIDEAGWIHSGDLAVMDDDGYVSIVGRCKDMIIRGGENIYPREIEEFLHTHPDIMDVQVTGTPSELLGEEVVAWVILKAGATLSSVELKAFCKGNIADYKIPRYIRYVDEFPMTVTGKVQKYKLRERA